jgi:hypothetical protein
VDIYALEPRLLLDAAAGVTVVEASEADAEQAQPDANAVALNSETDAGLEAVLAALDQTAPKAQPVASILFVDETVDDTDILLQDLPSHVEVVRIDKGEDGVKKMARTLNGRAGFASIAIISHGKAGEVLLGNATLNAETLRGYAKEMAVIGNALTAGGDILFFGCNVAEGAEGSAFLAALAEATGADIAGSDDLTGAASLGGDWDLEKSTGTIETEILIGGRAPQAYNHVLADPVAGFGNALDFDGTNDFVDVADITAAQLSGAITFEAWVNFDVFKNAQRIIDIGEGAEANDNVALIIADTTGIVQFQNFDGNGTVLNSIRTLSVLSLNTWTHVAAVTDGTNASIYFNGVAQVLGGHYRNGVDQGSPGAGVTSALMAGVTSVTRSANYIGVDSNFGSTYMDGTLDEIRVWNDARTASEIQANMYTPLKGNEADLAAYWNFDEGSGTTATDRSANAITGTLTNFALTGSTSNYVSASINIEVASSTASAVIDMGGFDTDNNGSTQTDTVTPKIVTLPTKGTLYQTTDGTTSNGTAIAAGDLVTHADGKVIYDPTDGSSGSDSYTYQVNDGTTNSANTETVTVTYVQPVAGFGNALDFDGTNDFVDVADITAAQLSGAVTIEAWVNLVPSIAFRGLSSWASPRPTPTTTSPSS